MNWETILKLGGEGGSVTLYGRENSEGVWEFSRERNESTLVDFLHKNEQKNLKGVLRTNSKIVRGWDHVIDLLPKYWVHLCALTVHPDFAKSIWELVWPHVDVHRLHSWAEACFPEDTVRLEELRKVRNPSQQLNSQSDQPGHL
jgi:hypothetical protein